jgi:hypothetical protein
MFVCVCVCVCVYMFMYIYIGNDQPRVFRLDEDEVEILESQSIVT